MFPVSLVVCEGGIEIKVTLEDTTVPKICWWCLGPTLLPGVVGYFCRRAHSYFLPPGDMYSRCRKPSTGVWKLSNHTTSTTSGRTNRILLACWRCIGDWVANPLKGTGPIHSWKVFFWFVFWLWYVLLWLFRDEKKIAETHSHVKSYLTNNTSRNQLLR